RESPHVLPRLAWTVMPASAACRCGRQESKLHHNQKLHCGRDALLPAFTRPAALALTALLGLAGSGRADEPFYKGKRLTLLINFAAGGPTDIEGRLFAKYLVKHIAGQPGMIVQNMDGAGGLIGAQYLGEIAPKDGTVVGYLSGSAWL